MCDLSANERTAVLGLLNTVGFHASQVGQHAPAVLATSYVHHEELLEQLAALATSVEQTQAWVTKRAEHMDHSMHTTH